MLILGINAFHGDSSACIVRDGELLAAVDEERFRRIKHWAGFPAEAIKYCLQAADANIGDVDIVAVNKDPWANFGKKLLYFLSQSPSLALIKARIKASREIKSVPSLLKKTFANSASCLRAKFIPVEHHRAHLASSFLVSPFERSALLSIDGLGDFLSTMGGSR